MIRAVLDTNVLVSALLFSGPASRLVHAWQTAQFRPVISPAILEEYLRVLAYPKFHLTHEEIGGLIQEEVLPFVETTRAEARWLQPIRDPDDAKFLECAVAARVPWLVSDDADLLDLEEVESVQIVTVATFLPKLRRRRR